MIFKTFDSNIDKISAKWGLFGRSFNDIGTAVTGRISDINKGLQVTNDLIGSIKNSDGFLKRLYPSKETIQSQMIYIDALYPERTDTQFSNLLNTLTQQQNIIDTTKGSWSDYFENLKDGEKWKIDFVQNTDLQKASLDDVKKAYYSARDGAIAHNVALKQQTLSAKAGTIALKGLAIAGNMLAMWAISKGIQIAAKAIDNYVHRLDNAKEALQETQSELDSVTSQIGENKKKIEELSDLKTPSITDKEDLERLKAENKELRIRQRYLEMQEKDDREKVAKYAKENFNKYYGSSKYGTTEETIEDYKTNYVTQAFLI